MAKRWQTPTATLPGLAQDPTQSDAILQVYGIVGNPVSHSRSPVLHNAAMAATGFDGVYIPLLVDDFPTFITAFGDRDFAGFSVTIPHKVTVGPMNACLEL